MKHKFLKSFASFGVAVSAVLFLASQAGAHAGHKHEAEDPSVSLPEVVAKVNGADIPGSFVWDRLKAALKHHLGLGHRLSPAQEKAEAKKLIEEEIDRELLLQKAKSLGISATPEMLDARVNAVKSRFGSEAAFNRKLAERGLTLDQYKDELKPEIVLDAVVEKEIAAGITVTPEEARAYYEKNKKEFWAEDMARASVILVKIDRSQGNKGEQAALEKIQGLLKEIKGGADFAEVAKKNSQDSLAGKGGDLGFFAKGRMLKDFSERAFKMNEGEVSEPFQTGLGYHLLKATGKKPGGQHPFEHVEASIRETVKKAKTDAATQAYVAGLRKNADVKVYF